MKADLVEKSIETGELQLEFWQKVTHFEIVIWAFSFSAFIPLMVLFFYLKDQVYESNRVSHFEVLWFTPACLILGIFFYFIQKRRLRFTPIETNLEKDELKAIIDGICRKRRWLKSIDKPNVFIAKTPPTAGSWGEQVTIIFNKNTLYLNSICDPEKTASVVSMGRNARNIYILERRIRIRH